MSSKEERYPSPVHLRAIREKKWIVMGRKWFTPDEFFREFGKGLSLPEDSWRLADPNVALQEGKEKIKEMILAGKPSYEILSALDRLYAFSDRVFKEYAQK